MKGSVFKYYNCHFKGRPRPEPWRSWRDLILQRVPAVVTAPNGASPQSKHCNPPIPSHSRISQLVPPEYGGNLGRGKIGTQTGVIFASPLFLTYNCIFLANNCIFLALFCIFLAYFCIFLPDPFQLARFRAVPVPFQQALQQQVRVHSSLLANS